MQWDGSDEEIVWLRDVVLEENELSYREAADIRAQPLSSEQKNPHHWDPHKGVPVKPIHLPHTRESHQAGGGHLVGDASLARPLSLPTENKSHLQGVKQGSSSGREEQGPRVLGDGWHWAPASSLVSLPAPAAPTMLVCAAQMQALEA